MQDGYGIDLNAAIVYNDGLFNAGCNINTSDGLQLSAESTSEKFEDVIQTLVQNIEDNLVVEVVKMMEEEKKNDQPVAEEVNEFDPVIYEKRLEDAYNEIEKLKEENNDLRKQTKRIENANNFDDIFKRVFGD